MMIAIEHAAGRMSARMKSRLGAYALIYVFWLLTLWLVTGSSNASLDWFASWRQWDASWYERIWNEGYLRHDPRALVFPPGYSILIGSLSSVLFGNFHVVAMVVNVFSFYFAMVLAAELIAVRLNVSGFLVFLFSLSSPAAYFVFTAYSDSVFSLLFWGALYLALVCPDVWRVRIALGAILFLLPWLRLTGYALGSWLVLKRWPAAMVLVSLIGWLALNRLIGGHATYFFDAQRLFAMPPGNILDGIAYTFSGLFPIQLPGLGDSWVSYWQFHLLPSAYLIAFIGTGAWLMSRREWLLAITLLSVLLMSHNQSFWRSVVRYNLPLMPLLSVGMIKWCGLPMMRGYRYILYILIGGAIGVQFTLQIYFATLFRAGHWAF